jgi:hypothetical protein
LAVRYFVIVAMTMSLYTTTEQNPTMPPGDSVAPSGSKFCRKTTLHSVYMII